MAGETGGTTDRLLNKLQYVAANKAAAIGTAATGDRFLISDVSDDYKIKYAVGPDVWTAVSETSKFAQTLTGSPWENVTVGGKTARIHRAADRLMIADAINYDGSNGPSGSTGTWLDAVGAGASAKMDYSIINAGLASVTSAYIDATLGGSSAYAVLGAARVHGKNTGSAIGLFGIGYNKGTSGGVGTNAWGAYVESIVDTLSARVSVGLEVEITNTAGAFAGNVSPYIGFFTGMNGGIFVGCGGGVGVNPTTFHSHFGLMFGENGQIGSSSFHRGIVFNNNSLVRDTPTTGLAHAILLPPNAAIEWYEAATEAVGFKLTGHVLDAPHRQHLNVDNTGMRLLNDTSVTLFWAQWVASAVNAPRLSPSVTGGPVTLEFTGADVNGSVALLGKGTEIGRAHV